MTFPRRKIAFTQLHVLTLAALLTFPQPGSATTLAELVGDPNLNPRRFAAKFEGFEFEFHPEVQAPETFLSSRCGDCDDFAILSDYVLRRKGFQTRLVRISLVGRAAHDVCYVTENRAYLDYNNRNYASNLERCDRRLRKIATEVADSFHANWITATEYIYDYEAGRKEFVRTIVKTDPPARDADA